jgi:hypothetical protein
MCFSFSMELHWVIIFVKGTNEWVGGNEFDIYRRGKASDEIWIFAR